MKKYRKLTDEEIKTLERQMCSSSDWDEVEVAENFSTDYALL